MAKLAARGDEGAFEEIFDRHHGPLLAFCRQMLRSREEGEDALQQTFMRAHRWLTEHGAPQELRPWLYAIARNRCRSVLVARRDAAVPVEEIEVSTDGLADVVQQRADLREIVADLARLPEDQRGALVLAELGDFSHKQIAEILGCPVGRVKALVFQAREALLADRDARAIPCATIREELATATGGALRRGPLKRHLRSCDGCRAYAEAVRHQKAALALILPVAPTLGLKAAVLAATTGAGGGAIAAGLGGGGAGAGVVAASSGGAAAAGTGAAAAGGGVVAGGAVAGGFAGGGLLVKVAIGAAIAAVGVGGGSVVVNEVRQDPVSGPTGAQDAGAAERGVGVGQGGVDPGSGGTTPSGVAPPASDPQERAERAERKARRAAQRALRKAERRRAQERRKAAARKIRTSATAGARNGTRAGGQPRSAKTNSAAGSRARKPATKRARPERTPQTERTDPPAAAKAKPTPTPKPIRESTPTPRRQQRTPQATVEPTPSATVEAIAPEPSPSD